MTRGAEGAVAVLPEPLQIDEEAVRAAAAGVARAFAARTAWRRDVDFEPRDREPAPVAPTLRA